MTHDRNACHVTEMCVRNVCHVTEVHVLGVALNLGMANSIPPVPIVCTVLSGSKHGDTDYTGSNKHNVPTFESL